MLHITLLLTLCLFAGGDDAVSFYPLPDYRGEALSLDTSMLELDLPQAGGSLFVPQGYKVELFAEANYEGRRFATRQSIPDLALTPFAEQAPASLRLTWLGLEWPDLPEDTTEGVTLFTGPGLGGEYQVFRDDVPRFDQTDLGKRRVLTALVAPGYQAVLYTATKYRADRILLQPGRHNLADRDTYRSMRVLPESAQLPLYVEPAVEPIPLRLNPPPSAQLILDHQTYKRVSHVHAAVGTALAIRAVVKGIKAYRESIAYDHGAILFDNANYRGEQVLLTQNTANLADAPIALQDPSSLVIAPGYQVIAYAEPNFQGASITLAGKVDRVDQPIRSLKLIRD